MYKVGSLWVWVADTGETTVERVFKKGSSLNAVTVYTNTREFSVGGTFDNIHTVGYFHKTWKPYSSMYGLLLGIDYDKINMEVKND